MTESDWNMGIVVTKQEDRPLFFGMLQISKPKFGIQSFSGLSWHQKFISPSEVKA